MESKISSEYIKLWFFSIFISLVSYGFVLSNYFLTIDNEIPVYSDYSLSLGRWGTTLLRYYIFHGTLPYFTLLLALLLLSLAAVEIAKLFKLKGALSYLFCALLVTFPQLAYQFVFTMQADVISLGFLCAAVAVNLYLKSTENLTLKSAGLFVLAAFLLMFVIALYQALIFIAVIIYIIYFFQSTYRESFELKTELKKLFLFGGLLALSTVLYFISVKIFCPPVEGGYFTAYNSAESGNRFSNFYNLWLSHLNGRVFYGERLFQITLVIAAILIIRFIIEKKWFIYRLLALVLILILPFVISFFITSGYNPPRLYVASGIAFAFLIVHAVRNINGEKVIAAMLGVVCLTHVYFITQLFYSSYQIFNHDIEQAKKIDNLIRNKYPDFDPASNYVYFYGHFPYNIHDKFKMTDSEIFGGSFFTWDGGSNFRICNFFKLNNIAEYRYIDNKETYLKIKDSISPMPVWPKRESVKMIDNVIVVRLGEEKGAALPVE